MFKESQTVVIEFAAAAERLVKVCRLTIEQRPGMSEDAKRALCPLNICAGRAAKAAEKMNLLIKSGATLPVEGLYEIVLADLNSVESLVCTVDVEKVFADEAYARHCQGRCLLAMRSGEAVLALATAIESLAGAHKQCGAAQAERQLYAKN